MFQTQPRFFPQRHHAFSWFLRKKAYLPELRIEWLWKHYPRAEQCFQLHSGVLPSSEQCTPNGPEGRRNRIERPVGRSVPGVAMGSAWGIATPVTSSSSKNRNRKGKKRELEAVTNEEGELVN